MLTCSFALWLCWWRWLLPCHPLEERGGRGHSLVTLAQPTQNGCLSHLLETNHHQLQALILLSTAVTGGRGGGKWNSFKIMTMYILFKLVLQCLQYSWWFYLYNIWHKLLHIWYMLMVMYRAVKMQANHWRSGSLQWVLLLDVAFLVVYAPSKTILKSDITHKNKREKCL